MKPGSFFHKLFKTRKEDPSGVDRDLNVEEKEMPDEATKQIKKDVKQYNKMIKEERKIALPPEYEPLVLNCDLLFGLADKLKVSDSKKAEIDDIIHGSDEQLFLCVPLNNAFWFDKSKHVKASNEIKFDGNKITVPATLVSENSKIVVKVTKGGKQAVYKDWRVKKVKRKDKKDINSFNVKYVRKKKKKQDFSKNTKVQVTIKSKTSSRAEKIRANYKVDKDTKVLFIKNIKFEEE